MSKRKPLPGMPFSLIAEADKDPFNWLESLEDKAQLLQQMRSDMAPATAAKLTDAVKLSRLAKQALNLGETEKACFASIKALYAAWEVEAHVGVLPRISETLASRQQKKRASESAGRERIESLKRRDGVMRKLYSEVSEQVKAQGKSAVARKIKELARRAPSQNHENQAISKLSEKQIKNILFR